MFSLSAMSGHNYAVLQDEVEGDEMTLSDAKKMLSWLLHNNNPDGLLEQQLMMELPALLKRLQQQQETSDDEYWEACVIDLLTKMRHELGYLPSMQPGNLVKDLFLAQEAVEKLQVVNDDSIVDIFCLLQQKEAPGSHKRRRIASTTSCRTWSVRLIALLGRMACVGVGDEETVAWTAVEARVWGWIQSSLSLLPQEVDAGLALAALDILDSARAQDAVVGRTRVTGLTPRHVVELLQKPGVDYYLEISTTVPRLSFLTHFADIFIQYSVHFQDDASLFDSIRACNDVMRLAFTNRPEFLLNSFDHASSTTSTTTLKKRKRIESSERNPTTSRRGRILARGYPFLVRLQVFLMNDERGQAFTLAKEMEHCRALSEDEQAQAWGFVMNYLQDIGQVFLDDNERNSPAYLQKRQSLIFLRQHMGNLGLDTLVDYYKQLIEVVSKDPYTTPQEIQYVTTASQHTVLRLLMLVNVDDGIKRMLDEFPSLYVWGEGATAKRNWAMHFLQTPNFIPASLLLDNGHVDLRSLLSRAPREEEEVAPPPLLEGEEIKGLEEAAAQAVQEHEVEEIAASSVEEPADHEAYAAKEPEVEEILDSSDEEPTEEQEVEEIIDSSDNEKFQQEFSDEEHFEETFHSSDDEPVGHHVYSDAESDDDELLEESVNSDEYSAGQEPGNEIVEIVDSSSDDAEVSGTEQEAEDYESEQPDTQAHVGEESAEEDEQKVEDHESEAMERRTHDGEETADEDDVAALFSSNVAGERLELVREAIDYYDEEESTDEGRRGSFGGEEGAQGEDEDSWDKEEVHEQEQGDVEKIVDSSETEDMARGGDEGGDTYSSDDEEVAREEQCDHDSSEDEGFFVDGEGSNEAEPEKVGEEDHLAEGYEPDTAGQTESEEDDDDRRARNEASATRKALGSDQIAFRTTFSDMDAADERDESSGVEDIVQKERATSSSNALNSAASSPLVAFAQSAQQEASVTWEEEYEAYTSPSRPPPPTHLKVKGRVVDTLPNLELRQEDDTSAAVAASDAEKYLSEAGTVSVVDAVPRIEDVHEGEGDTTATVAFSEGSQSLASQPMAETNMMEKERAQEHVAIVNQIPMAEDARLGDKTSATFAASEAGPYHSEANTERITQPEESVDTEKQKKFPCAANGAEEDSQVAVEDSSSIAITEAKGKPNYDIPRRASDGVLSDRAGYEADEEKTDVENSARSVPDKTEIEISTRSVAGTATTGYEADIEEKTPLFIPAVRTVDLGMETPGHGYEADVEGKDSPKVEESQPEPSPPGDSSGIANEKAKGAPSSQEDESVSIHPEINPMPVATAGHGYEADVEEKDAPEVEESQAGPSDPGDSSETANEKAKVAPYAQVDESVSIHPEINPMPVATPGHGYEADVEEKDAPEVEESQPKSSHPGDSSGTANEKAKVAPYAQEDESVSIHPEINPMPVATPGHGYEADVEGKDATQVEESQAEPSQPGDSSGTVNEKAKVAPYAQVDESVSIHPEINSMPVAIAETDSHEPLAGPSPQVTAKSDVSGNEAEEIKVDSVSTSATRDDETGSMAAPRRPSRVPSAHAAAESNESGIEAEEHAIASVSIASVSSVMVATREGETGSVAPSVRKVSRRKGPPKQQSDFEYYEPAAKRKRRENAPQKDDVSASAPAAEDGVDKQEIAEVFPSIPPSTTAEEHDASSGDTRPYVAVEAATEPRATRRPTRGNREKEDYDEDEASNVPRPSRSTTRGRTASSLRTRSHDASVEIESKDSATEGKARATRNSRKKKGEGEEVEVDREGASDERHRIMALKVADLRVELQQRGLDTTGLKTELQSRLLRDAEETMNGLGSPERHTRSHDSATTSSHHSMQGLESPAGHTRSHDSPVSTRHSRATRTKNTDEAASKAFTKKFKPTLQAATKKAKIASKTATKKSETDLATSTADSKASTRKSGTRSSTKGAKSEVDSENRDSLGSNPEGRAISFPVYDESNDFGSLSSVESSVVSPARRRLTRGTARRTSLGTVPENEDSSSHVSSIRGRRKQAATHGASLATVPENSGGETLSAPTARTTRSRRSNVEKTPVKRRKSDRSVASVTSTTRSGRVRHSRS